MGSDRIAGETETQTVERKRRKRQRRQRLQNMIYPVKRSIGEYFSRTGDSEAIAEGYGVVRADIIDRALHGIYRRVERIEATFIMAGAESPDKKEPQSETRLSVVPRRIAGDAA